MTDLTWQAVLILGLGTFRLTRLIVSDTITKPLWSRLVRWASRPEAEAARRRRDWLVELFSCPWCIGFWIALAAAVAWRNWPHNTLLALGPFALSAAVGLLSSLHS